MMIMARRGMKKLISADYSWNDHVMPVILLMTLLDNFINNNDEDHNNNEANWAKAKTLLSSKPVGQIFDNTMPNCQMGL